MTAPIRELLLHQAEFLEERALEIAATHDALLQTARKLRQAAEENPHDAPPRIH